MAEKRMTAKQIQATLKPFRDFAPAILDAAQIADEAEANEKDLANREKRNAQLAEDTIRLEKEKAVSEKHAADAKKTLDDTNQELAKVRRELDALTAQRDNELNEARTKLDEKLKFERRRAESQILEFQVLIDAKRKELEQATHAFDDFKKAHGF